MKINQRILLAILVCLGGCGGGNPSAPTLQNISLGTNYVQTGSVITTWLAFRVSATKGNDGQLSDPFSAVVNLPIGAALIPETSFIPSESAPPRPPDVQGTCPDGSTYMIYNFQRGEFNDQYHFNDYTSVMYFNILVVAAADQRDITGATSLSPIVDGCAFESEATAELRVSAS